MCAHAKAVRVDRCRPRMAKNKRKRSTPSPPRPRRCDWCSQLLCKDASTIDWTSVWLQQAIDAEESSLGRAITANERDGVAATVGERGQCDDCCCGACGQRKTPGDVCC